MINGTSMTTALKCFLYKPGIGSLIFVMISNGNMYATTTRTTTTTMMIMMMIMMMTKTMVIVTLNTHIFRIQQSFHFGRISFALGYNEGQIVLVLFCQRSSAFLILDLGMRNFDKGSPFPWLQASACTPYLIQTWTKMKQRLNIVSL